MSQNYHHEALAISSEEAFLNQALKTFQFQYQNVLVYQKWVDLLGVHPPEVKEITQIPFLPIEFFKTQKVIAKNEQPQITFKSSGTVSMNRSRHMVADAQVYQKSFLKCFELFYGAPEEYTFLALLPSYISQGESSLVYMFDTLIAQSKSAESGFYLHNYGELVDKLRALDQPGAKVILLGVSYALLDICEQFDLNLNHVIVMETGGMKGRRKEMVKKELHEVLKKGFGVSHIHSEYGMTELLSQAYSKGDGVFNCPPFMRVLVRDATDPLSYVGAGVSGGINVIDLSNYYSCAFIATQDLGKVGSDGSFEILGRFDHTDVRGCNLLME